MKNKKNKCIIIMTLNVNKQKVNKLIETPLSPNDLQLILKHGGYEPTKILYEENVVKNTSINDLFSQYNDAIIYAETSSKYNGHFQCMIKNDETKTIYWFDSYGHSPKFLFDVVEEEYGRHNNANIYAILLNSGYELFMNSIQYQGKRDNEADCGRWCCSVIMLHRDIGIKFDFQKYYNKILYLSKVWKLKDFDEVVTIETAYTTPKQIL